MAPLSSKNQNVEIFIMCDRYFHQICQVKILKDKKGKAVRNAFMEY